MGTDISTKSAAVAAETQPQVAVTLDAGCIECCDCSGPEIAHTVEVLRARVGVETVQAYGLTITLDANGDAAMVEFPYGAEVLA